MDADRSRTHHPWRAAAGVAAAILLVAASGCSALYDRSGSDQSAGRTSTVGVQDSGVLPPEESSGGAASGGATDKSGTAPEAIPSPGATPSQAQQLLVRTATMRLRVEDIDKTLDQIRAATAEFKGQIDDLQVSTENDTPIYRPLGAEDVAVESVPLSAYVTVRVPSDRLAEFSRRVASFGKVLRESANQTDVTQQHVDMTARLKNLRAEEARLRDFLKDAKNVREMLLVETELSRVRGEIESMQSQLDYLDKQISYGTLTVELQKPAPVVRPSGTDWGFAQAITDGIRGAAAALRGLITIVIALSPVIVLVLIAALVIRWLVRRRRRTDRDESPDTVASGENGVSVDPGSGPTAE